MTDSTLRETLLAYAAGIDAELELLDHLHAVAAAQQHASDCDDAAALHGAAGRRDDLLGQLHRLEEELLPLRKLIATNRERAARIPEFARVAERHRAASDLVARIVGVDEQTLSALRDAETARRRAAQAIEAGGQTLAAYRRVVSPSVASAALLNERG